MRPRLDVMRPFTRAQARVEGITDRELAGPRFRRLFRGVYVAAAVPDSAELRAAGALLLHPPGAVATHTSAARVLGAPVPPDALEHVTVADPADRRRRDGIRCHVAALEVSEVQVVAGLRISSAERMFVELASALGLVDLVVLGDWMVRRGLVTPARLTAYCQRSADPHARHAARAASYVRERVDSPMESRLRMLIVLAGLPEPEVNLRLRGVDGHVLMRLDLSYPSVKLAVEYDGRQHVEVVRNWEGDVERRDDLPEGWRLLTVTSKGIYREPERTVQRVWRALHERRWPGLRRPTDGWRPHFR